MQHRETWLLKSWFCKWKCSATGDLWNLRFVQSERWPFMRSLFGLRTVCHIWCTWLDRWNSQITQLSDQLRRRGYNVQSVAAATSKARSKNRADLLRNKPKPEPSSTLIPFMLTYHPELPKVKEIVNKHWPIIESSKRLNKIFPQKPIMAYKRPNI